MLPLGFPAELPTVNINGEVYVARLEELDPERYPDGWSMMTDPPNFLHQHDPTWYDGIGQDQITQRRIWGIPLESDQIEAFRQLLQEFPTHSRQMMLIAATRGKLHVLKFLVEQGVQTVRASSDTTGPTLDFLHAAAKGGDVDCVRFMVEDVKLAINEKRMVGTTPLMEAIEANHTEVVSYLLDAGADIFITSTPPPSPVVSQLSFVNPKPRNALEFATGTGSMKSVELILKHARALNANIPNLVTGLALAGAAQRDNLDMMNFLLETGAYPRQRSDGTWPDDTSLLTAQMKANIEMAFQLAIVEGSCKVLKMLSAYFESRKADGTYHWTSLSAETKMAAINFIWKYAGNDDEEHTSAFELIYYLFFNQASRLTDNRVITAKSFALANAFFMAASTNCPVMMQLMASMDPMLHTSMPATSEYIEPRGVGPLHIAATYGNDEAIEVLISLFKFPDHEPQVGSGTYLNGPTGLWHAVWNNRPSTVKLLLEKLGGPVESIDPRALKSVKIVVAATDTPRNPVRIISASSWGTEHGDLDATGKTKVKDTRQNEIKYVVLDVGKEDKVWLERLKLRKSDQELSQLEGHGRPIRRARKGGWSVKKILIVIGLVTLAWSRGWL